MAFPILQFGTSRFLQAHVDLFVSEALKKGEAMGRIVAVQTTQNQESRKRIAAFARATPYIVQIKGIAGSALVDDCVEVSSVGGGFDANEQWEEVEGLFNEARCVVSNTADRGYEIDAEDWPDARPPRSFPAKLAKLLLARHRAGAEPITLFPCELTPANGEALRRAVMNVLDCWDVLAPARRWIGNDCIWVNSLVDRIVPQPLEPLGAVAEPYALWAIEDRPDLEPPCRHADIKVTNDLERYERLKLFILRSEKAAAFRRAAGASRPSHSKLGVQPFEFDAGVFGCELPIGFGVVLVSVALPGGYFFLEGLLVGDATAQALPDQNGEFGFGHVEPASVLGRVMPFEPLDEAAGFGGGEGGIERGRRMGAQVVLNQHDFLGGGEMHIG